MSEAHAPERQAARGTGAMRMRHLLRDRSLRLAAALAIAVATPVAVLFYFQFRSLDEIEDASAVILRQLSEATADRLALDIRQALKAPHSDVLLRITNLDLEQLNLPVIEPVLANGLERHRFIDTFFLWSGNPSVPYAHQVLVFGPADRLGGTPLRSPSGGATADFHVGAPESASILEQLQQLGRRKHAITMTSLPISGRESWLVFRFLFASASRDRVTSAIGFRADAERFRREYLPRLLRDELARVPRPAGSPPVITTVVDAQSAVVFQSEPADPSRFIHERAFPFVFFDPDLLEALRPYEPPVEAWRIRTGYGDRTIDQIASAHTGPQLSLMVVLAAIVALGVFLVSRAAAREVRLAELKSNFVSSVSHDLKTPLALIQLFAETLELGRLKSTERAHEYYRIINDEARKLTRLINNILDFSKIEAGLRRYRLAPVDLVEVTRRVLASLEHQFQQGHFTVTTRLDPDLPLVMIDIEAVQQALENLLSNAMKYSPDHREIRVEVGPSGPYACVRVIDRGIGIPRQFHRRIFQKFYRVEMDKEYGPPGTGLGLAIVDHVMRGHGGLVRVESETGRGSTFTLCFPLPAQREAQGEWGLGAAPIKQ